MDAKELTILVGKQADRIRKLENQVDYLTQEFEKQRMFIDDLKIDVQMLQGRRNREGERMLKVGDTIQCHDADDMIDYMQALLSEGIDTDFLYEKDGEKGLWLIVTEVPDEGTV